MSRVSATNRPQAKFCEGCADGAEYPYGECGNVVIPGEITAALSEARAPAGSHG